MTDDIQSRIVSLIPSNSLKRQILLSGFQLSDADLLSVAFRYAPDQDARIGLLRELEQRFSGELKAYAARLISVQRQMLESFLRHDDGTVYELHVKQTPDSYDERYLCRSFGDAVKLGPLYYREYSCRENASSRYMIDKRRILSEETGFCEDELGNITLLPDMKIESVDVYALDKKAEECCGDCQECDRPHAVCHHTVFPAFIKHGDAVRYREYSGEESFGIALVYDDLPCSEYCIIPLDSDAVRYRDLPNIYDAHRHIPAPLAERIEEEDLPQSMREDHRACYRYVMENRVG